MSTYISIDPNALKIEIDTLYTSRNSGATLAHPGYYPRLLVQTGINARDAFSNVLLGTTATQPDSGKFILGVSYYDLAEGAPNEDFFEIDTARNRLRKLYRGSLEQEDPRFANTHKGEKDYLMDPIKSWEIFAKRIRYRLLKGRSWY